MGLLDLLMGYFKKKKIVEINSPDGTCPVCWGYQSYDRKVRTMTKNKDIDVKNHKDKYVKVEKFMVEHVEGAKKRKVRSRPFRRDGRFDLQDPH